MKKNNNIPTPYYSSPSDIGGEKKPIPPPEKPSRIDVLGDDIERLQDIANDSDDNGMTESYCKLIATFLGQVNTAYNDSNFQESTRDKRIMTNNLEMLLMSTIMVQKVNIELYTATRKILNHGMQELGKLLDMKIDELN